MFLGILGGLIGLMVGGWIVSYLDNKPLTEKQMKKWENKYLNRKDD